ncbi:hypothetical protein FQR65_LT16222 [Abscondita terminalis]|nr:hypothetical protein FQR65_LT16222 [Abscondita terminalis]
MIEHLLVALLSNGHVLIEGVPGVAKTITAKLLAKTIAVDFSRIQFTPDLMPSDILGTAVFNAKTTEFEFKKGPIFSNFILIDEINRSPAKTQAALFSKDNGKRDKLLWTGRKLCNGRTFPGLVAKRYKTQDGQMVPSYPSFIHLRKYELMAMQNEFLLGGIKKIRKIGHTMEFEQIREYVTGDDIRSINWKATGKQNRLMINQYQEERAQRVYMLIDKGRTMKMPFNGLSLLDYSINASMALAHIILKKQDRAGVMTFSKKMENTVAAELKAGQIKKIAEALYNINTNFTNLISAGFIQI